MLRTGSALRSARRISQGARGAVCSHFSRPAPPPIDLKQLSEMTRLRAKLLFDTGVQRRLLLQRGPRHEMVVEASHKRFSGRHRKL
jgi:hypothetical protein